MKKNIFFTNEMEAKPPTHHKKGITSRKSVNFWPGPKGHGIFNIKTMIMFHIYIAPLVDW